MEPRPPAPDRRRRVRTGVVGAVVSASLVLAACSDDADDDDDATIDATVAVDEDFPGDALDATCARLDAGDDGDPEATAAALLDELSAVADPAVVVNTLELAVIDRCPEWADAVTAAIESRS